MRRLSAMKKIFNALLVSVGAILPILALAQESQGKEHSVLTGMQVTYSIASALLKSTPVTVVNIPEDGRRFTSLKDYIERRVERFAPTFEAADAVIAVTNVIPADPLYRFARDANIHLIYIDAAQPWSFDNSGVSIVEEPRSNVKWAGEEAEQGSASSAYFWLSITNAIRMTDIVAEDLARVFPDYEKQIQVNRNELKAEFLDLSRDFQNRLFDLADASLFALAGEFVYLTNDAGLFVDGYFIKQDIDWTEEDLHQLSEHLRDRDIAVVIHKWQPSDAIQKAIGDGGVQLVVLDTADPGLSLDRKLDPEGYQKILKSNLEKILGALESATN